MKIKREEFYNEFVELLLKKSSFKGQIPIEFYWSGKEAESKGYGIKSNINGMCYYISNRTKSVIILKYRENQVNMFKTFIHEIAHAVLHYDKIDFSKEIKEIEAETIAKLVMENLGFDYKSNYIEKHQIKHRRKTGKTYSFNERQELIDNIVNELLVVFKPKADTIRRMCYIPPKHKNDYKYSVSCPCCNKEWFFKRATNLIKRDAEGFYCVGCGKDKTNDKLIIKQLR